MYVLQFNPVTIRKLYLGKKQEDLIAMLEKEPDFSSSKTLVEELVEEVGGKVIWGVAYHPEFMMIESCYR